MKLFDQIKVRKPRHNAFDLSHERKMTMNMADLVPFYVQEILPGDHFRVNTEIFMRTLPLISPAMHRLNVYTHFFFVPNRLTFKNWGNFITGGEDGKDVTPFPVVSISPAEATTELTVGSLADYLGLPIPSGASSITPSFSALPFRAYQLIYNEYYRDQNLVPKVPVADTDTVSGVERPYLTQLRQRAYEKDYFTSCLPWAQKGDEVQIPIAAEWSPQYKSVSDFVDQNGATGPQDTAIKTGLTNGKALQTTGATTLSRVENLTDPQVAATGNITINELRVAVRLQEWLEKNARAGSRYIESLLAHFGVISSDARLQRPEYLGGGKQPISISEVLATFEGTTVQGGQMFGHGISVGKTNKFKRFFEEHGYIIGIMSILPRTAYMQGTPKHFQRFDKFDYAWPEFAHLGEQEVLQRELYLDYADATGGNNDVFGYQSRYAEYKYAQSTVHGDFRDNLKYWTLVREFGSKPLLNEEFITAKIDNKIFPVDDTSHKFLVQLYNDVQAVRPLPVFGTPML